MITGIHHVSMATPDIGRIMTFYREVLGLQEVSEPASFSGAEMDKVLGLKGVRCKVAFMRSSNLLIEFFEFESPAYGAELEAKQANRPGYTHIAFDVVDINSVYQRAKAAGATFHAPPQDFGQIKATYARDPDGNIFEIQELMTKDHPWRYPVLAAGSQG